MTVQMPGALLTVLDMKTELEGYLLANAMYGLGFAGGAVHAGNANCLDNTKTYTHGSSYPSVYMHTKYSFIKFVSFELEKKETLYPTI